MTTLRYRKARNSADVRGQVFTPASIAERLAKELFQLKPDATSVMDIGAGRGSLIQAVLGRFEGASAVAVEIERRYAAMLSRSRRYDRVVHGDALVVDLGSTLLPDLVVSNPPYSTVPITGPIHQLLAETPFSVPRNGGWVRADAAFVAKLWQLIRKDAGLGLIVASAIVRDPAYRLMRKQLLSELRHLTVTQLHESTFPEAEVRAFMLTGQRGVKRRRNVLLRKIRADGCAVDEMSVTHEAAAVSLDIDFHRSLERLNANLGSSYDTLGALNVVIARGSKSLGQFRSLGIDAFHTTHFRRSLADVVLKTTEGGFRTARPGDLLISRVGSRCLDRQARVVEGVGPYTDCVYRLTVPYRERGRVWRTLNSGFGAEWRLANAEGSCAKYLTVDTLRTMPVIA